VDKKTAKPEPSRPSRPSVKNILFHTRCAQDRKVRKAYKAQVYVLSALSVVNSSKQSIILRVFHPPSLISFGATRPQITPIAQIFCSGTAIFSRERAQRAQKKGSSGFFVRSGAAID